MGALAMWGAIGGAGKGEVENAEAQRKVEAAQMESDRQMRLAKFSQDNENQRQEKTLTSEESRSANEIKARQENVQAEQTGATGRTKMEIDERKAANEGRSKAMIQIGAGHDAARRDAAAAAKAAKDGWSQKVLKSTGFDPQSHLPVQNDTIAVSHPAYGTFIQKGDKFVPQGTEPKSISRAPTAAVNDLLTDPDKADDFISAYHYLPAPYFKVLAGKGRLNMSSDDDKDVNAEVDKQQGVDPESGRTAQEQIDDNAPAQ